ALPVLGDLELDIDSTQFFAIIAVNFYSGVNIKIIETSDAGNNFTADLKQRGPTSKVVWLDSNSVFFCRELYRGLTLPFENAASMQLPPFHPEAYELQAKPPINLSPTCMHRNGELVARGSARCKLEG
ncbi:MAG: hypothetical protein OIF38_11310, partial [Cellvibrionaceae bacterium]|nr:hypothetical protein [Cellvibrionaceae bacterium]